MKPVDDVPERGPAVRRALQQAIADYWVCHGYAPAVRDLQDLLSISSTSVVAFHLGVMEREGMIVRDPMVSRSIRLARS